MVGRREVLFERRKIMIWDLDASFEGFSKNMMNDATEKNSNYVILRLMRSSHWIFR